MYGRLIWVARYETPKIRKMRRTVGSVSTPRIAPNASARTRPVGMTSGRTSASRRRRAAPSRRTALPTARRRPSSDQPSPSIEDARPDRRPEREPDRPGRAEEGDRRAEAAQRGDVADAREHHAGVAELEPDQQHRQGELPRLARQRDAGEDHGLDEGAPDDDGLAAVLVRPDAPQRDEGQADDEDQRAEEPDERQAVRLVDAHLAEVRRQQGEDLATPMPSTSRGDPEDGDEDAPVLGGARAGQRVGSMGGRAPAKPSRWSGRPLRLGSGGATPCRTHESARRNWWEPEPFSGSSGYEQVRSPWSPPGPSLAGLAALEPGSRDRPVDHSSDRSGGSHLPLRARRNVRAGA